MTVSKRTYYGGVSLPQPSMEKPPLSNTTTEKALGSRQMRDGIFASGDWMGGYFSEHQRVIPAIFDCIEPLHGHWQNINLPLCMQEDNNINFWELVPVWLALQRYAPGCRGMHIVAFSDNLQVVHAVNKGISSNKSSMELLCGIF